MGKMRFGALAIQEDGTGTIELAPVVGAREPTHVSLYLLSHSSGWTLKIAYAKFIYSTDVRCLKYSDPTPDILYRLTHGLRMSVIDGRNRNTQWAELKANPDLMYQPRPPGRRSNELQSAN